MTDELKPISDVRICQKKSVAPQPPGAGTKLGVALATIGKVPINGMRCIPEPGTNGWYIWCGDVLLKDDDFFSPLHVEHIDKYIPAVTTYLDLPPGYRFQIDSSGYEDIWLDLELFIEEMAASFAKAKGHEDRLRGSILYYLHRAYESGLDPDTVDQILGIRESNILDRAELSENDCQTIIGLYEALEPIVSKIYQNPPHKS